MPILGVLLSNDVTNLIRFYRFSDSHGDFLTVVGITPIYNSMSMRRDVHCAPESAIHMLQFCNTRTPTAKVMEVSTLPMLISPVISNSGPMLANPPVGALSYAFHCAYALVTFHIHFACGSYTVFADFIWDFAVVTHWEIFLVSSSVFSRIFWDFLVAPHSEFCSASPSADFQWLRTRTFARYPTRQIFQ